MSGPSKDLKTVAPSAYYLRSLAPADAQNADTKDVKQSFVTPIIPFARVRPASSLSAAAVAEPPKRLASSWLAPLLSYDGNSVFSYNQLNIQLLGTTPLSKLIANSTSEEFEESSVLRLRFAVKRTVKNEPYVWIGAFYSRIQNDPEFLKAVKMYGNAEEQSWFKGIGHSALCYLLELLIQKKAISSTSLVALEASGAKMGEEDASPLLIHYYASLGFRYPQPISRFYAYLYPHSSTKISKLDSLSWQYFFKAKHYVPMSASVSQLLTVCVVKKGHLF